VNEGERKRSKGEDDWGWMVKESRQGTIKVLKCILGQSVGQGVTVSGCSTALKVNTRRGHQRERTVG
jgi:hypothetical protein